MELGTWLAAFMESQDPPMSDNALGHRLGHTSGSLVTRIKKGLARIPIDQIAAYADALKLNESDRGEFVRLAHLSHGTDWLRREHERLRQQLIEMMSENQLAWKKVRERDMEVASLRARVEHLEKQLDSALKARR